MTFFDRCSDYIFLDRDRLPFWRYQPSRNTSHTMKIYYESQWPAAARWCHFVLQDVSGLQSWHLSMPSHPRVPPGWPYSQSQSAPTILVVYQEVFLTWFFSGSQSDPCFQNKNSGCRLTERLSASPVRTLVHCVVKPSRPPDLKSSSNISLPYQPPICLDYRSAQTDPALHLIHSVDYQLSIKK